MNDSDFTQKNGNLEDGDILMKLQQQGIADTLEEFIAGKGIAHQKVMDSIRKKYSGN